MRIINAQTPGRRRGRGDDGEFHGAVRGPELTRHLPSGTRLPDPESRPRRHRLRAGGGARPPPTRRPALRERQVGEAGCGPFHLMKRVSPSPAEAGQSDRREVGLGVAPRCEEVRGKPGRRVRGFRSSVSETTANSKTKGTTGIPQDGLGMRRMESLWPPFTLRPVSEADGGFMIP